MAVSVTVFRQQVFLGQTGRLRIGTLRKRHSKCVKRIGKGKKMPSKDKPFQNILKISKQAKNYRFLAGMCVRKSLKGLACKCSPSIADYSNQKYGHFETDERQAAFVYYAVHQRKLT